MSKDIKEICVIKLTSGAEIITNAEYDKDVSMYHQTLKLKKPFRFDYIGNDEHGMPRLGFFPYAYSDATAIYMELNGAAIEAYIPEKYIEETLKKEYLEKSSGIILA